MESVFSAEMAEKGDKDGKSIFVLIFCIYLPYSFFDNIIDTIFGYLVF